MAKTKRSRRQPAIPLTDRTYYCAICTKPFTPEKWNQKTCCGAHANELERRKHREKTTAKVEEKHSERFCIIEECRKPFKPRNNGHLCCSTECSDLRKNRMAMQKRAEKRGVYASDVGSMAAPGVVIDKTETDDLISEMHKRGFFVTKAPVESGARFEVDLTMFEGDVVRFGVMSDTHLCSKQQQLSHLRSFYRLCAEREIDTVLHIGDLCEGTGKQHEGQIYDLFIHGQDEQTDYIVEHYPNEPGITTHFILGSHDESFWKASGYDIGRRVSEQRPDMKYMGFADAYIDIAPNVDINMHHPDGGSAYALSYNAQKRVEAYPPELKPRIALFGHYHRSMWMPAYRNVDTFLVPCFQSQTLFLKKKKIYPIIGGWIIEATVNEDGLANIKPECIRFYVPVANDY